MRTYEVKVTEEVEYTVRVEAENAEEAEEIAIDMITDEDGDGDRDQYCTGVPERYAEVQY
ncbi:hypothetical protein [Nocardiopsis deserti]|uniref:hypothetical protein n=1 Tax=Nocardiopsis deserti TaxID=2605988 RepID=UPI00123B3569|nr:hypothetical protein [Nocardiopsis deserti]